jgi:hypothetical protein
MLRGVDSESLNEKAVLMAVARNSGRVSDGAVRDLTLAYDKLAEESKDKVNIVAVDCDAHRALCTKNGVKGFPTIKLYVALGSCADVSFEKGTDEEYKGARSLEKLKAFAEKAVKPWVHLQVPLLIPGRVSCPSNLKTLSRLLPLTKRSSCTFRTSRPALPTSYVLLFDLTDL